jgi:hypothetical protein
MPRSFAMNNRDFSMATWSPIFLALVLIWVLSASTSLLAQGPALTTINEVRYSDQGWGVGYNGNLVGRFTSRSFSLTRYVRAQNYYLKNYDGSGPPKYSRYAAKMHVDYPL